MTDPVTPLPLTEREQKIWDLKELGGLTHLQIGEQLGLSKSNIDDALHNIRNKLEGKHYKEPRGKGGKAWCALDKTRPDEWAQLVDELTNPIAKNFVEMARETGINVRAVGALAKKLEAGVLAPVAQEITAVKTERLQDLTSYNAGRVLEAVTDEDIAAASLRDKAIASAVWIDKGLLLAGRPTEIIEVRDGLVLKDLMKMMTEVTDHRGIEIEVNPADPTSRPTHTLGDPYNPHADRPKP